jgi:hypothetical protein
VAEAAAVAEAEAVTAVEVDCVDCVDCMAGTEFLLLFPTHCYGVFFFQFFSKPPLAVSRSALKKRPGGPCPVENGAVCSV